MNIAVIAPHCHGNGLTTVATLIASELSHRNKKVCISHVKSKSDSFMPYFDLKEAGNQNSKALVSMIKNSSFSKDSIPNYCRNISDKFDLFSLDIPTSDDLTEKDVAEVIEFMMTNAPYDYMIYDVDENSLDMPNVKKALEYADCAILVLTQAKTELNRFKEKKGEFNQITKEIPVMVVLNKYDVLYGHPKDIAAYIGVTNHRAIQRWKTIRYNKYIPYCENKGNMNAFLKNIAKRDADVLGVSTDVTNIVKELMTIRAGQRKILSKTRVKGD